MIDDTYLTKKNGIYEVRGAAGSGKTYQLTKDIRKLSLSSNSIFIISYSNAAVDELKSRLNNPVLSISTIHSFCWKILSNLSLKIIKYNKDNNFSPDAFKDIKFNPQIIKKVTYEEGIPFFNNETGELFLSHNDIINLFIYSIKEIPELRMSISNTIDYLLIDEYQDTNGKFLQSIFEYLSPNCTIGLYGDPCQSIYLNEDTINISSRYDITSESLKNNYRSRSTLVEFFNEFRNTFDKLDQVPQRTETTKIHVFARNGSLNDETVTSIENKTNVHNETILSLTNILRTKIVGLERIAKKLKKDFPKKNKVAWEKIMNPNSNEYTNIMNSYACIFQDNNYLAIKSLLKIFTKDSLEKVGLDSVKNLITKKKKKNDPSIKEFLDLNLEMNAGLDSFKETINLFNLTDLNEIVEFYKVFDSTTTKNITIFKSKGLEFENVLLNIYYGFYRKRNWNNINFNHKENDNRDTDQDIMYYLFYVGITRAKNNLNIYINSKQNKEFLNKFTVKFPDIEIQYI